MTLTWCDDSGPVVWVAASVEWVLVAVSRYPDHLLLLAPAPGQVTQEQGGSMGGVVTMMAGH